MTRADFVPTADFTRIRRLAPSVLMIRIGLCLVALWAIFALVFFETRRHVWNQAVTAGSNLATLVESAIAREIEVYDLSIRAAARGSIDPAILSLPPAVRRQALFDRSSDASRRGRMLVVDATGHVIAASQNDEPIGLDLSDREYFTANRADPKGGLQISGPFMSRISHQMSVGLSRRRPDADGRFNGVIVGTIQLDFFTALFSTVRLDPGSTITLIKGDGTIMTRVPFRQEYVGRIAGKVTSDAISRGVSSGTFRRPSATDGVDRLFSFHQVGTLPLYINVGLSTREVFDDWRWEMLVIGLGFAFLSAFIVILGATLAAELRRRAEAECRLGDLACTDYLTLLANRRRFDDVLNLEWRRAVRSAAPLSLLMIDCDYFKGFNDTYGHPAGDSVLQSIAVSLRTCVDRPGDLVARYGGEEFAVLLPSTDEAGALIVARALRAAVDALDLAHTATPSGRLTVSIGLASFIPLPEQASGLLVDAADAALYIAKREGRDRIVRYGHPTSADEIRHVA